MVVVARKLQALRIGISKRRSNFLRLFWSQKKSPDDEGGAITSAYLSQVNAGKIRLDKDQLRLASRLDDLYDDLQRTDSRVLVADRLSVDMFASDYWLQRKTPLLELISKTANAWYAKMLQPTPPRGIYIYGHVGVGKSFLMDLFHQTCLHNQATTVARRRLRRAHFHEFMLDVHDRIHRHKMQHPRQDALPAVALSLAREARILAFDEFQVTDIADAMILKRLFHMLWNAGTVVVATSNRSPDSLYEKGLNRALFLPFIDLLKANLNCIPMVGSVDYRREKAIEADSVDQSFRSYFWPSDVAVTRQALEQIFAKGGGQTRSEVVPVRMGRTVAVSRANDLCGWVDFMDMCHQPLGAADYLAVCERFPVLILDHVPQLNASRFNEARRFVTLIDALYESKTRLVLASQHVPLEDLLVAFQATVDSHDGDEEMAGEAIQETRDDGNNVVVKGEGGSSSSAATTFVRTKDGTEVEWSATGRVGVSLAQLSSVQDVSFSFQRAESRLAEMNSTNWGRLSL